MLTPHTYDEIRARAHSLPAAIRAQEEQNRGKANWEHLNDELHVLITVEDTQNRAQVKLRRALDEVRQLLVPIVSIIFFSSLSRSSSLIRLAAICAFPKCALQSVSSG